MRRALVILLASVVVLEVAAGAAIVGSGRLTGRGLSASGAATPVPAPGADPSTSPSPSAPTPASLTWTPCDIFECATVPVPLDYAQPGGRQLGIAINRRPALDADHRIGSLLVNPGGPGVSGVDELSSLLGRIPAEVRQRFDVIGFDPRGTGQSSPVHCLPAAELSAYFALDPTPDDEAEKAALIQGTQHFVAGCQQRSGDLLAHVGTEDAARDMDRIRAALGDEKLTYVGFSYGTELGGAYASLFPNRVRALVLDGAVDPSLDTLALNRAQGEGFDRAFDDFAADCRAQGSLCAWRPAGGATKQTFLALSARVDARPVPAGNRRVGPSELLLGTAAFLYAKATWSALARGLARLQAGDGSILLNGFDSILGRHRDGTFSNEQEANAAINCLDRPAPKDLAVYERAAAEASTKAPAYGAAIAWSGVVCGLWPVPATGRAEPLKAPGSPPILVVGTTNDPATPFVWAEALASQLPQGRLLRHEGEGHTTFGEDPCTTRIGDAYLLTLALPPGELRC